MSSSLLDLSRKTRNKAFIEHCAIDWVLNLCITCVRVAGLPKANLATLFEGHTTVTTIVIHNQTNCLWDWGVEVR